MKPLLQAVELCVGFAGQPVLTGVNLVLQPGERLALVGANGSGKSTLLRTLAGLLPPLSGQLNWRGAKLGDGAARVRTLGVLLQNESPVPFSVREQVSMGLALDGPPDEKASKVIDVALERAELQPLQARSCDTLSGGEAQRVRFARTSIAEPKILLLDEPTNHLDPARCAQVMNQLAEISTETAVLVSTHDLSVAAACDRVLLLHEGGVLVQGFASKVLVPEQLRIALGVDVQRVEDPHGGPPFFRVAAAGIRR